VFFSAVFFSALDICTWPCTCKHSRPHFWFFPKPERASNFLSLVIPTFKIRLLLQLLALHPLAVRVGGHPRVPSHRNRLSGITGSRLGVTNEPRPHAPIASFTDHSNAVNFPCLLTGTQANYIVRRSPGTLNVFWCATIVATNDSEVGLLYRQVCGPTVI
jgi:hypothetical protein